MATDPDGSTWLLQFKLLEYYVLSAIPDVEEAQKQLYLAVMRGEIRARAKGIVLGPEWLKQISHLKPMKGEPFALPGDVELSVEDTRRKFGTD